MQTYPKSIFKPPISIIVPAHNSEKLIPQCLTSLFQNTANYMGFCQIIVIDNGSTDYTYEMAWATIHKCRRKWPMIHGKVVRITAKLDRKEAIKIGANKAFGTLIAVVDPKHAGNQTPQNCLSKLMKRESKTKPAAISYRADVLRNSTGRMRK